MTPNFYDEVRWAVTRIVGSFESALVTVGDVSEDCVVLDTYPSLSAAARSLQCRWLVERLTAEGFVCTRSRTRVYVRRSPEVLGPPDFVCRGTL